jgi:hypothetical protein
MGFMPWLTLAQKKMAGLKAVLDAETNGKVPPFLPEIESRPSIPIDWVIWIYVYIYIDRQDRFSLQNYKD